jgi:hypothetical protein
MLQFHVFSFPRSSAKFVPGSIYQSRNGYSKAVFKMKIVGASGCTSLVVPGLMYQSRNGYLKAVFKMKICELSGCSVSKVVHC